MTLPAATTSFVRDPLNIGLVYKARAVDEIIDSVLAGYGLSRFSNPLEPPIVAPDPSDDPLGLVDG